MNEPFPEQGLIGVPRTGCPLPAPRLGQPSRLSQETRRVWMILRLASRLFLRIDGAQWAGAFAFHAFFSLFPAMVLLVTMASGFIDRDRATSAVITFMEKHVPISGEMQRQVVDTVAGVIQARKPVGLVAFLILVWGALQCFTTLVCVTNRAWGTAAYNWWRLPLKSLALLGVTASAVLLGMTVPVLMNTARGWLFPVPGVGSWVYGAASLLLSRLVVYFGLGLFYRLAPRRSTRFAEVWAAALCATLLLWAAESLFVIYMRDFATLNALYGAFGGIMALLLWIYLSGCVFIFGVCLCAAGAESRNPRLPAG
jgi:YihY family inner membrane protein